MPSRARQSAPSTYVASTHDVAMLAQPFLAFLSPLAVFMILAIVRWDTPQAMIPQLVALTLYLGSEIWWSHAVKKAPASHCGYVVLRCVGPSCIPHRE